MPRTGAVAQLLEFVGMLPASDEGYLVKRLIGLPGDRVVYCDSRGRVSVNGVEMIAQEIARLEATWRGALGQQLQAEAVAAAAE